MVPCKEQFSNEYPGNGRFARLNRDYGGANGNAGVAPPTAPLHGHQHPRRKLSTERKTPSQSSRFPPGGSYNAVASVRIAGRKLTLLRGSILNARKGVNCKCALTLDDLPALRRAVKQGPQIDFGRRTGGRVGPEVDRRRLRHPHRSAPEQGQPRGDHGNSQRQDRYDDADDLGQGLARSEGVTTFKA